MISKSNLQQSLSGTEGSRLWLTLSHEGRTHNGNIERIMLKGFSLLEMLVVLLIISVTMGLFFGLNFRQKESVVIRSFASEMSMLMTAARSQALLKGKDNFCIYHPEAGRVFEELSGREIAIPEGIELFFRELDPAEKYVFASFFPDGSIILENFVLRSGEHEYVPVSDPFMGRVRFEAGLTL